MTVKLQLLTYESGTRGPDSPYRPNEDYFTSTFIDADSKNRMTAFLRWDDEAGKRLKVGDEYLFAVTGLGPVKNDRSSYYLRGAIVQNDK